MEAVETVAPVVEEIQKLDEEIGNKDQDVSKDREHYQAIHWQTVKTK